MKLIVQENAPFPFMCLGHLPSFLPDISTGYSIEAPGELEFLPAVSNMLDRVTGTAGSQLPGAAPEDHRLLCGWWPHSDTPATGPRIVHLKPMSSG